MKKKDMTNMHAAKAAELTKTVNDTRRKLADYLVNRYSKQSKNVREGTAMRRKIAVVQTILREKELHE